MALQTLMVHLTLGRPNTGLLRIADSLATRCDAGLVGIAACQPMTLVYGEGYVDGALYELDRQELTRETAQAEAEFRTALSAHAGRLGWRASLSFAPLAGYLAQQARCADLVLSGLAHADLFDASRSVDSADLVLQAGRPVLLVPEGVDRLALDRVLVGCKDSRESRRALADALPLLQLAARVTLVEIAPAADEAEARARLADVGLWLQHHGVTAGQRVLHSDGDDAGHLALIADADGSDMIVAGAYGHGRLREWVLGGVTRDLLLRSGRCTLLSH